MSDMYTLKSCPFCGHQPDEDNLADSVHPVNRERSLWTAACVDNEGGCNASVLGDSREQAIALWNTRSGVGAVDIHTSDRAVSHTLSFEQRIMILCSVCGNKRCPHAESKLFKCTGSNAVGQIGELIDS